MSGKKGITAEELLKIPEVQEVTGSVSRELVQRRRSQPAVCDVFNHPFTALKTDDRYRFEIDREARKQLPDIIGNSVQALVGLDAAFRADEVDICRFGFLGAVIVGPGRCQCFEACIGENYPFVYNIKVEDVKHSLCAGVSMPTGRRKGRFGRFSGRWRCFGLQGKS